MPRIAHYFPLKETVVADSLLFFNFVFKLHRRNKLLDLVPLFVFFYFNSCYMTQSRKDMSLFRHLFVHSASLAQPRCLGLGMMGTINKLKANSQILKQAYTLSRRPA